MIQSIKAKGWDIQPMKRDFSPTYYNILRTVNRPYLAGELATMVPIHPRRKELPGGYRLVDYIPKKWDDARHATRFYDQPIIEGHDLFSCIADLLRVGWVESDDDTLGSLRVTESGRNVIRGLEKFLESGLDIHEFIYCPFCEASGPPNSASGNFHIMGDDFDQTCHSRLLDSAKDWAYIWDNMVLTPIQIILFAQKMVKEGHDGVYLLWEVERKKFWRHGARGYVDNMAEAQLFGPDLNDLPGGSFMRCRADVEKYLEGYPENTDIDRENIFIEVDDEASLLYIHEMMRAANPFVYNKL